MAERGIQRRSEVTDFAVAQYEPALRRYFGRRVSLHEVDDLVQEVFANLQARRAEAAVKDLRGYLFVVAGNVLTRKRSHDTRWMAHHRPEVWEQGLEISPERVLAGRQQLGRAFELIASLPPKTREVFVLHRFEDMTYRRISEELRISVSSVEKHIMAALEILLSELDP